MSDPIPADGPWILARVLRGLSIDGFDPDDVPQSYSRLIAAALAAGSAIAVAAANAEMHTLPRELPVTHGAGRPRKIYRTA